MYQLSLETGISPVKRRQNPEADSSGSICAVVRPISVFMRPGCTPTLATVTLFSFVGHWNSWYDGMIYMKTVDKYPLQTYLQTIVINPEAFFRNATNVSQELGNFINLANVRTTNAAQLFLATIPILCIYPFLQKYFTTGLVMGSVKG